ncbi:MAG: hypothetical protein JW958_07720 [Candidatus Eisenbacteria bacterium]|nr:hypothetical protein [Candidatus Eisenbacteria bacterium]
MKRTFIIGFLIAAAFGSAGAQLDSVWTRPFGGPGNDGFRSVVATSDGAILAVGYTYSFGAADVNVYAVKADANGDTIWTRAYGGAGRDYGYGVCETADGGYVITGYTTTASAGYEDLYLIKIDADGDTLWTRSYGGAGTDEGRAVSATSDGYILAAGTTESYGAGLGDIWLLKLDAAGDTVWTRTYGGVEHDWALGICETGAGIYGLSATTGSTSDNRDIEVLRVDPSGALLSDNWYGNTAAISPDWGGGICATQDSGLAVGGFRSQEGNVGDACVLVLYGDGSQRFFRTYSKNFYQYACDVLQTWDNAFLTCGADKDPTTMSNDLYLLARKAGAGWVVDQTIGGPGNEWGSAIDEIAPGHYVVAGHTNSYGAGGFDGWLVRLKDPATSVGGVEDLDRRVFFSPPRPNPARASLAFRMNLSSSGSVNLRVIDVSGRHVRTLHRGDVGPGAHDFRWDTRDDRGREVASGVYFIVADGSVTGMRRAVVIR